MSPVIRMERIQRVVDVMLVVLVDVEQDWYLKHLVEV
ncbi:hypothetical protein M7I_0062 [Glarea lozoyensis 74030]|uniref:Uncharacterized protein n=1 Tax=Glarea lozoyensis (strain ATCC 74030 / MF5533) TaxID=1104152 RepID=H0ECC8_GLAL7|nr:hypothetical protein M7I_0062 [Glarea lozoyensis 74030]